MSVLHCGMQATEVDSTDEEGICQSGHKTQPATHADRDGRATERLTLHRARHLFIRQQTVLKFNRAYLSEFAFSGQAPDVE
ncbi:hypothetical protein [Bradyrhizobium sp. CCGE-LA001]|uniref:hypothetical protein n=1 Tax=Bradyrhizobium sp. CCGE-LA001 TaxID=1223566 RepID=UPI0011981DC8|nr:hypothetical protein [Bradyrhizobium sp. CCGE-LA001]